MNAVEWIEARSGLRMRAWQCAVLRAMFPPDGSPSPWETFLISAVKKTGKTTLNAWATLYAALHFPAGETAYVMANDQAQAEENTFELIAAAVRKGGLVASGAAVVRSDRIVFPETGTRIVALPADFAGSAGARFGISSWTELWAYRFEAHVRLWEELTPNPNRRSLRIVDSYAGFTEDAPVLEPLWARALAGERGDGDLPVFTNGRLWAYIDQGEEAQARGWLGDRGQMAAYYAEQRASLRPGTFNRLHLNQWQSGEEAFVTAELWDACVLPGARLALGRRELAHGVFVGVDAATKSDSAAVVAVTPEDDRVRVVAHRIWTPRKGAPLDLEATIEAYLLELRDRFSLASVPYDPYQMARSASTLRRAGVPMDEFAQSPANLTAAGQALYDLIKAQRLATYPDEELRRHVLNAVAIESARGWRLAKEKASRKIDAAVALSFACLAALHEQHVDRRASGSTATWRTSGRSSCATAS